jgi:type II secretory pathway pseudopilin PulG
MVAMFALVMLAVLATRALQNQHTNDRRDREEELIFVGQAYINAIGQYYEQTPGTEKRFPPTLKALLVDDRAIQARRPLRRQYLDPITNSDQWGLVTTPEGAIMGVFSLAPGIPIKVGSFPHEFASFAAAKSYQEWKFVYVPRKTEVSSTGSKGA